MDNKQAMGYMMLACKEICLDKETTQDLVKELYYLFDIKTEEEAEEQGFDYYHILKEETV